MTPHDALAEGRLADAVAIQRTVVDSSPSDPVARRLLVDLLGFAGQLDDALKHLAEIESSEPEWCESKQILNDLFRAERIRSQESCKPQIYPQNSPKHAACRWMAITAMRQGRSEESLRCIDAADAAAPEVWGFIDGQEFEGLRDADDCFASVLEALQGGDYAWFAWEAIRKVEIAPATVLIDQLYRPATVTLKNNSAFSVHLPLMYPGSCRADDHFALGTETDYVCPDGGPTRCVGGKLLLVGDEGEVPLRECRMIEIR